MSNALKHCGMVCKKEVYIDLGAHTIMMSSLLCG